MSAYALTLDGVPVVTMDGRELPLFFPVTEQQAWAECLGLTLDAVYLEGFTVGTIIEHLREFLSLGLQGGEARRHACRGGQALGIDEALVDRLRALHNTTELVGILLEAWNWAPSTPDPQAPAPAAETANESDSQSPGFTD